MMFDVYNKNGQKIGNVNLPKEIFEKKINSDLLHQVIVSQASNRRQGNAQTKDRGEVRGGGRKPWAQKGTGRSRHGSIRSPIWAGGGVVFGPRNVKNYKKIIPKQMKKQALFMVLSGKAKEKSLVIIDNLEINQIKTKEIFSILKNFSLDGKKVLIALPEINKKIVLAARNIAGLKTIFAKDLNAFDLLNYKYLFLAKESIKVIKETFLENDKNEL